MCICTEVDLWNATKDCSMMNTLKVVVYLLEGRMSSEGLTPFYNLDNKSNEYKIFIIHTALLEYRCVHKLYSSTSHTAWGNQGSKVNIIVLEMNRNVYHRLGHNKMFLNRTNYLCSWEPSTHCSPSLSHTTLFLSLTWHWPFPCSWVCWQWVSEGYTDIVFVVKKKTQCAFMTFCI